MGKLFLLLGGNQGNKRQIFTAACASLEERVGTITAASSIYETEPWGFKSDDMFWNQVVVIETRLSPVEVLKVTKSIEADLGRVRQDERYCSRTMDIDLLFYDDMVCCHDDMELPHPRITGRRFVLQPLAEVAADMTHPQSGKSIRELLAECSDKLTVNKLEDT